jgi:hypothetical protein
MGVADITYYVVIEVIINNERRLCIILLVYFEFQISVTLKRNDVHESVECRKRQRVKSGMFRT